MADNAEAFAVAKKADCDPGAKSADSHKSHQEVSSYLQDLARNHPEQYSQTINQIYGRMNNDSHLQPLSNNILAPLEVTGQQANGTKDSAQTHPEPLKYQIASGDTLWGIADRFLQKSSSAQPSNTEISDEVQKIRTENNIGNADRINLGSIITIDLPFAGGEALPKADHTDSNSPEQNKGQSEQDKPPGGVSTDSGPQNPKDWLPFDAVQSPQQTSYTCSISSMQMALATYRLRPPGAAAQQVLLNEITNEHMITSSDGFLGGAPEIAKELNTRGLHAQGMETRNIADLDDALAKGHTAIVNGGNLHRNGSVSGHFIFVRDRDASGGYEVNDPASGAAGHWSKEQMNGFLSRSGPGLRGVVDIWK